MDGYKFKGEQVRNWRNQGSANPVKLKHDTHTSKILWVIINLLIYFVYRVWPALLESPEKTDIQAIL